MHPPRHARAADPLACTRAPPPVPARRQPLTAEDKQTFLKGALTGVSLASDAFFPFRDNIDVASRFGVKYLVHPGGSVQDEPVTAAANEYGMVMAHSGVRLFHH